MGRAKKLECSVLMEYHAFQVDTFRGIDNQRISIIHIVALSFSINITWSKAILVFFACLDWTVPKHPVEMAAEQHNFF